ncbi:hypothetical protein Enr8_45850 [Blastopirellula retiformator]|uniref:Uncharacterized protein n=1 Tax=Blastopirellula retiformator TaxID=2527970 RepID=A0A5C5UUW8_9BACT|nr:hypothetical protein Enr8_45850 [Blastopirellula retiformator]
MLWSLARLESATRAFFNRQLRKLHPERRVIGRWFARGDASSLGAAIGVFWHPLYFKGSHDSFDATPKEGVLIMNVLSIRNRMKSAPGLVSLAWPPSP